MPLLTLKDAADYVRTAKASTLLLAAFRSVARIFNFVEERHNRLSRYVAVIKAYERGMPINEIETKFGCTKRTIYDYVKRAGVPHRSFKPEAVKQAVLRDYRAGIPIANICSTHEVSPRYVHAEARKAGLRRNNAR